MRLNRRANHLMKISWIQLRTLLVFALIFAYTSAHLSQGYQVRQTYQIALNAWGTFACTMNNTKILLVCFAGYVLLLSDLPCFHAVHMYEMVRSKRREVMAVDEMGLGYRVYIASPLSYTRLEILGAHVTNGYYPSLAQIALAVSLLFFGTLLGCLLFPVARRFNRLSLK